MSRKTDRTKAAPKILDGVSRARQLRHHLESLERDNFVPLNEFEAIIATAAAAVSAPGPANLNPTKLGGLGGIVGTVVGGGGASGAGTGAAGTGSVLAPTSRNKAGKKDGSGSGGGNTGGVTMATKKPPLPKTPLNQLLLELDLDSTQRVGEEVNYLTATMGPSRYPNRHFCTVCGWKGKYRCSKCGMRYCDLRCQGTHEETRCMKFTI